MTIKKFFVVTFLQAIAFGILKLFFYNTFDLTNPGWYFLYWGVTAAVAVFLVRAAGFMNYLEALFMATVWLILDFVVDAIVVYPLTGGRIFSSAAFWIGYLFMALFVLGLHKKRHVAIRHGQWHDPHHH